MSSGTSAGIQNRTPRCETMSAYPSRRRLMITTNEKSNRTTGQLARQKEGQGGLRNQFNRYFYQYTPLRSLKEIADEMLALERKSEGLLNEVLGL